MRLRRAGDLAVHISGTGVDRDPFFLHIAANGQRLEPLKLSTRIGELTTLSQNLVTSLEKAIGASNKSPSPMNDDQLLHYFGQLKEYGEKLWKLIFTRRDGTRRLEHMLQSLVPPAPRYLLVRLSFDHSALYDHFWELARPNGWPPIGRHPRLAVVRQVSTAELRTRPRRLREPERLKIFYELIFQEDSFKKFLDPRRAPFAYFCPRTSETPGALIFSSGETASIWEIATHGNRDSIQLPFGKAGSKFGGEKLAEWLVGRVEHLLLLLSCTTDGEFPSFNSNDEKGAILPTLVRLGLPAAMGFQGALRPEQATWLNDQFWVSLSLNMPLDESIQYIRRTTPSERVSIDLVQAELTWFRFVLYIADRSVLDAYQQLSLPQSLKALGVRRTWQALGGSEPIPKYRDLIAGITLSQTAGLPSEDDDPFTAARHRETIRRLFDGG